MPTPAMLPLAEVDQVSLDEVGPTAREYFSLSKRTIPLPAMAVIPKAAMWEILAENRTAAQVKKLLGSKKRHTLASAEAQHLVYELIKCQKLPAAVRKNFVQQYHANFSDQFVQIFPSHRAINTHHQYQNLLGEATVLEAVLLLWAELAAEQVHQLLSTPEAAAELLVPSAIIIQAQPQPASSGLAFTKHPHSGDKSRIVIQASRGVFEPSLSAVDLFEVGIHDWSTIHQRLAAKKTYLVRTHEGLQSKNLPKKEFDQTSLTPLQVQLLAQLVKSIKQRYLTHKQIEWILVDNKFYVTRLSDLDQTSLPTQAATAPTQTQVLAAVGKPELTTGLDTTHLDGLLLKAEYTFAKFGYHPLHALTSRDQRQLLHADLSDAITSLQHYNLGQPVIYRSLDFTTTEYKQLLEAEPYEPTDPNPSLGYRGGLRLQLQPEVFEFELEVLKGALKTSAHPLYLAVGHLRRPAELQLVADLVQKHDLTTFPHFQLWWQLNTPENVLNLAAYPLNRVQAVVLHLESIHHLLVGADPENPDTASNYPHQTDVLIELIERAARTLEEACASERLTTKPALYVYLDQFNRMAAEAAVMAKAAGIIVKPAVAGHAKACIMDVESRIPQH